MIIRTFSSFINNKCLERIILNDSTVVIDGQNFFYNCYKQSNLQFLFGSESDKYANYLRNYLSMFQRANVKCYFIFKGGHEDFGKRLKKQKCTGKDFIIGNKNNDDIVPPIFANEICYEVLTEMGFNYTTCKMESKKECLAFAQKHQCPIISNDIEFCFTHVLYIPYGSFKFDEITNTIHCGMFTLDKFLQYHRLTEEKLALFAALTDENQFPLNHFESFFKSVKISNTNRAHRNANLLKWLAKTSRKAAISRIFHNINHEDKKKFLEIKSKMRKTMQDVENPGVPTEYLENNNTIEISRFDPRWFEKGVASNYIAAPLVNIAQSHIMLGSWAIADNDDVDPILLSIEILKYIYNLLTNFEKHEITFISKGVSSKLTLTDCSTVRKPYYKAVNSVFENGWDRVQKDIFHHFLNETIQGFNLELLHKLPEDSRLLMIALIYFSRKKPVDTTNEVYSILLSYIVLNVLFNDNDDNNTKIVNKKDKITAIALLNEYFCTSSDDESILDLKMLHPLVEFQFCLLALNQLNQLCGYPYKRTVYSKVYNGTFVYKVVHEMKINFNGDGLSFLKSKLISAGTVLAFISDLLNTYHDIFSV